MTEQEHQEILAKLAEKDAKIAELSARIIALEQCYAGQKGLSTKLTEQDEKFATISELHRIFAEKFAEYDRRIAKPKVRQSRRPA
ncbi:MAG: hypothetical protein BWK79_15715 [Beggiatoa sp. IS2]|nr:MAG: hypothetical protein BWK79_15715 [Beggiatoa sp. IS2]